MTAAVGWLWGYKPARVNIPGTSVNIVAIFVCFFFFYVDGSQREIFLSSSFFGTCIFVLITLLVPTDSWNRTRLRPALTELEITNFYLKIDNLTEVTKRTAPINKTHLSWSHVTVGYEKKKISIVTLQNETQNRKSSFRRFRRWITESPKQWKPKTTNAQVGRFFVKWKVMNDVVVCIYFFVFKKRIEKK